MAYEIKALSCNPTQLKGLSEKLIVSHYENNYGGAVKRLNAITAQLESLDFATAPVFVINGLKREKLIASNSMILHELYFDSLGGESQPDGDLRDALARAFGSVEKWQTVCCNGQGAGRRFRVGVTNLLASGQEADQPMGCGPYLLFGRSKSRSCSGYVRTFLSHRLRRKSSGLCRRLHRQPVGKRFNSTSKSQAHLEPGTVKNEADYARRGF
jgi:hypothetical protein